MTFRPNETAETAQLAKMVLDLRDREAPASVPLAGPASFAAPTSEDPGEVLLRKLVLGALLDAQAQGVHPDMIQVVPRAAAASILEAGFRLDGGSSDS